MMRKKMKSQSVNPSKKSVNLPPKRAYNQAKLLEMLTSYATYKKIQQKLNLTKYAISVSFKRFKKYGLINEDRTLTPKGIHLIKTVNHYSTLKSVNSQSVNQPSDSIRLHNLVFTLEIPKIQSWDKRRQYLNIKNIKFKKLNQFRGEALVIENRKVWLTPKSIIIYMGESYFKESPEEAMGLALEDLFKTVNHLEKMMKQSLKHANGYRVRVSRQHHALIKNALAKKYNKEHKKFYCRDENGVWLVIDNSFQLHETETIRAKTAHDDIRPVQDLFNSIKEDPFTSKDIRSLSEKIIEGSMINKATAEMLAVISNSMLTNSKVLQAVANSSATNEASILTMIRNIQETQKIIIDRLKYD